MKKLIFTLLLLLPISTFAQQSSTPSAEEAKLEAYHKLEGTWQWNSLGFRNNDQQSFDMTIQTLPKDDENYGEKLILSGFSSYFNPYADYYYSGNDSYILDFNYNSDTGEVSIYVPYGQVIGRFESNSLDNYDIVLAGSEGNYVYFTGGATATVSDDFFSIEFEENTIIFYYLFDGDVPDSAVEGFHNIKMVRNLQYEGMIFNILDTENKTCILSNGKSASGDVVIPDKVMIWGDWYTVTAISSSAFSQCRNLTSVTIPNSVTSIGQAAFCLCHALKGIIVAEDNPSYTSVDGILFSKDKTMLIQYPGGKVGDYEIPDGVTNIECVAFAECFGLTSVSIPNSVTTIDFQAFQSCTGLTAVTLPNSLTKMDRAVFQGCTGLTSITIPNSLTYISSEAFYGCTSLTSVTIPNSVTYIGWVAFCDCTSLTSVTIPNSVTYISSGAFSFCNRLTDIYCYIEEPIELEGETFDPYSATLHVPVGLKEAYISAPYWNGFENIVDDLTGESQPMLSHSSIEIAEDEAFQISVYNTTSTPVWSSSNPAVAYVNECGLIVSMGIPGSTTITATVDGKELQCEVTVSSVSLQMKSIALANTNNPVIEPTSIIIESVGGNPPMVNARLVPVGSSTLISWTTSNPSVATVDHGLVTVISDGSVDFGVETDNGLSQTQNVNTDNLSGIEDVIFDQNVFNSNVYDLSGRIVLHSATPQQIVSLPKGIYIVRGKKILVK